MGGQPQQNPIFRSWDNNGNPLVGGLLNTYAAGTTTPQATYTDSTLATPNTNPVILNFRGEAPVWMNPGLFYKFILTDALGNLLWSQDNIPGSIGLNGFILGGNIIPFANNTFTLGNPTDAFANVYLGPNGAPVFDPVSGNVGYYKQTTQEAAVPVSPTVYVPSLQIDLERYGGGVGATASQNNTALTNALAVLTKKGGGTLVARGSGTYAFSGNGFSLPSGTVIQGDGYDTIWLNQSVTTGQQFLNTPSVSSGGGRTEIRELQLIGPGNGSTPSANVGVGILLGDSTANAGWIQMRKVLLSRWGTAMQFGGLIWGRFELCEFGNPAGGSGVYTNNIGIDFNFTNSGNQVNAVSFQDCIVSNNANNGVKATNVAVIMNAIQFLNCTIQNNCQNTPANPQFQTGAMNGFSIKSLYMEYTNGGTAPDAIDCTQWSSGSLEDFFISVCAQGIRDHATASMGQVSIRNGAILSNTGNPINCLNEVDLKIENVFTNTGTVIATNANGSTAFLPTGYGVGAWKQNEVAFTPVLAAASGTITQTTTGLYSQVGNTVTFAIQCSWSSISGASGNVTITGLPVVAKSGAPNVAVDIGVFNGITLPTLSQLAGQIANNTSVISLLFSQAAFANLTVAALAAAGQITISGSYQV
jgi:hypothetical protein